MHQLIICIFAHNVIPKKRGRNDVRQSDVYFLDKMINGQGNDFNMIALPSIIICYMRTVARSRALLWFSSTAHRIFEYYGVNRAGKAPVLVRTADIIMVYILHKIQIDEGVLAQIPGEQQARQQEEQEEGQQANAKASSFQARPSISTRANPFT